ncbi:MAG: hypothetical protein KC455_02690 [Carnobacterium sp.]|nr:hypothetical protein [Carnobacterium sp.]
MERNEFAYFTFAEFSEEIDGKLFITVDYILKGIKQSFLNVPIYEEDKKDYKENGSPYSDDSMKKTISNWLKKVESIKNKNNYLNNS